MRTIAWIFHEIGSFLIAISRFYLTKQRVYPEGEAGALLECFMKQGSWFDRLSHDWYQRSFFNKARDGVAVVGLVSMVGLLINAALLFAFAAGLIVFMTNKLLVMHDEARWEHVNVMVNKLIQAEASMEAGKACYENAATNLATREAEVVAHAKLMEQEVLRFAAESHALYQENQALGVVANTVMGASKDLVTDIKIATGHVNNIASGFKLHQEALQQSTDAVLNMSGAAIDFSASVRLFEKNGQTFTRATNDFCLFVNDVISAKPVDPQARLEEMSGPVFYKF